MWFFVSRPWFFDSHPWECPMEYSRNCVSLIFFVGIYPLKDGECSKGLFIESKILPIGMRLTINTWCIFSKN